MQHGELERASQTERVGDCDLGVLRDERYERPGTWTQRANHVLSPGEVEMMCESEWKTMLGAWSRVARCLRRVTWDISSISGVIR